MGRICSSLKFTIFFVPFLFSSSSFAKRPTIPELLSNSLERLENSLAVLTFAGVKPFTSVQPISAVPIIDGKPALTLKQTIRLLEDAQTAGTLHSTNLFLMVIFPTDGHSKFDYESLVFGNRSAIERLVTDTRVKKALINSGIPVPATVDEWIALRKTMGADEKLTQFQRDIINGLGYGYPPSQVVRFAEEGKSGKLYPNRKAISMSYNRETKKMSWDWPPSPGFEQYMSYSRSSDQDLDMDKSLFEEIQQSLARRDDLLEVKKISPLDFYTHSELIAADLCRSLLNP
jgi:hypothetical protein